MRRTGGNGGTAGGRPHKQKQQHAPKDPFLRTKEWKRKKSCSTDGCSREAVEADTGNGQWYCAACFDAWYGAQASRKEGMMKNNTSRSKRNRSDEDTRKGNSVHRGAFDKDGFLVEGKKVAGRSANRKPNRGKGFDVLDEGGHFNRQARGCLLPRLE